MKTFQVVTLGLLVTAMTQTFAGAAAAELPRVRSTSPRLAAIIEDARERSETFRVLVETINSSDGIVYVQEGQCGHGILACFTNVTAAGPNRFLWVRVDMDHVDWDADWDLMGTIGHELHHVVEVLSDRTVRSDMTKHLFYALKPDSGLRANPYAFDTEAAILAGLVIRAEARRHTSRAEER